MAIENGWWGVPFLALFTGLRAEEALQLRSDAIKGLPFERFLGGTFRGSLGQFFPPRPTGNFMVDLLDPWAGETVCDPAGSGGFLIRAFERVRAQNARDIQARRGSKADTKARSLPTDQEEAEIQPDFHDLDREPLLPSDENEPVEARVGRLARDCVSGCDAEPRAARTAKMNMILDGDGHGGIHRHDGIAFVGFSLATQQGCDSAGDVAAMCPCNVAFSQRPADRCGMIEQIRQPARAVSLRLESLTGLPARP
jgi:hypothetical protein